MSLTLVSLFDGIGGFPLAFESAGCQTVSKIEIDSAAAAVAGRHFPHAHHYDDVTQVKADDIRADGFISGRGIVTAGWPCQDFSVAGRRAGLAGARSGLWWEVVRILADLRPRWFVGENVPGLLSSVCEPECPGGCMETHGGAMGAVLGSLAELGYGFSYRVLDAQYFGVPQHRRRVVIVGHLGAPFGAAAEVLFEPESSIGDSPARGKAWPEIAGTLMAGTNSTGGTRPPGTQVDTISTLVLGVLGRQAHTLTAEGCDAFEDGTGRGTPVVVHPLAVRGRDGGSQLEVGPEGGPYNALRAGDGGSSRQALIAVHGPTETVVRRLTEVECERLQGYSDDWTGGQSGGARYKQLGNSIAVPVFEWVARRVVAVDGRLAIKAACGMCARDFVFASRQERHEWFNSHDESHSDFVSFFRERAA